LGDLDLVCIDNVQKGIANPLWEMALFSLFNQLKENKKNLLISANRNIKELGIALPDLFSRLQSGLNFKLESLSDQDKKEALILRCACRGIELPLETVSFLLSHSFRDLHNLSAAVDQMVDAAIESHRLLTVPFAKTVLKL